jgi:Ala-tRNA(Pro) deacylase
MKQAEVIKFLAQHGIPYRLQAHEAVFTIAESSKLLPEKIPVKTLLVREEKGERVMMVAMRGNERLDMKMLARQLDAKKLRFVKPEDVEALVGVKPGSVSIFGLLHLGAEKLEVILDESLLTEPELGFHPNDNTATVFLAVDDVRRVIESTGHTSLQLRVHT